MNRVDYLVIGSGGAGLYTALLASAVGSVAILTKGRIEQSNTWLAQGGIAAPLGLDDSPEKHAEDTLAAGAGLCDPGAVRVLTEDAVPAIEHLVRLGMPFDTLGGELALGLEGAHQVARIVHAGGDATGANLERTLIDRVREAGVRTREHCRVTRIVIEDGRACGVEATDLETGERFTVEARWTILATGGAGQIYRYTTNPPVATGDGLTLAFAAGAQLADLEFFQFHPTALHLPGAPSFLISEAVRGDGGYLINDRGERFMRAVDERVELAPRDIVARAIVREMEARGTESVWLDVRHLPAERVKVRFPTIYQACLGYGLDITREPIPVAPAAHYYMGGIRTNSWGETSVPDLFACGECACTGIHGANRLASNSLLELLVFARRIVCRTMTRVMPPEPAAQPEPVVTIPFRLPKPELVGAQPAGTVMGSRASGPSPLAWEEPVAVASPVAGLIAGALRAPHRGAGRPSIEELQALMWRQAGISRTGEGLGAAAAQLDAWLADLGGQAAAEPELASLTLVSRLLVEAAWRREESRGGHYRADFPQPDPTWQKRIIVEKERGS